MQEARRSDWSAGLFLWQFVRFLAFRDEVEQVEELREADGC